MVTGIGWTMPTNLKLGSTMKCFDLDMLLCRKIGKRGTSNQSKLLGFMV